jgi:hypothetical protein
MWDSKVEMQSRLGSPHRSNYNHLRLPWSDHLYIAMQGHSVRGQSPIRLLRRVHIDRFCFSIRQVAKAGEMA